MVERKVVFQMHKNVFLVQKDAVILTHNIYKTQGENNLDVLSVENVYNIVCQMQSISEIERDENSISFRYIDNDGDNILVMISIIDEENISIRFLCRIGEGFDITAMIICALYNNRKTSFGTFAYSNMIDDDFYIILESNVSISGGVNDSFIRHQIRNYINIINEFESFMISNIFEIGPDSRFIKTDDFSGFFDAIGQIAGGTFKAWLNS